MKNFGAKRLLGKGAKVLLVGVVAAFMGLQSFNFWKFTFPPEQWFYSFLGFGLTGGAVVGYLVMLLWESDTPLRNVISVVMLVVSVIGELLTAGFGLQVEIWRKAGFSPSLDDYRFMTVVVQALGLFHAAALILYFAGDRIAEIFGDEDRDGIPNYRDRDYKGTKAQNKGSGNQPQGYRPPKSTGSNAPKPSAGTSYTLPSFLEASGMETEQAFGNFLTETDTITMAWKVLRDKESTDGYKLPPNITHANFDELAIKVRSNGKVTNP